MLLEDVLHIPTAIANGVSAPALGGALAWPTEGQRWVQGFDEDGDEDWCAMDWVAGHWRMVVAEREGEEKEGLEVSPMRELEREGQDRGFLMSVWPSREEWREMLAQVETE